jgi:hypothetical protein
MVRTLALTEDGSCVDIPAAPSYFTQFFEEQIRQNEESGGVRTLYIDRDPATFRDVARHLQGLSLSAEIRYYS